MTLDSYSQLELMQARVKAYPIIGFSHMLAKCLILKTHLENL